MTLIVSSCSVRTLGHFTAEEEKEDGEIVDLVDSHIYLGTDKEK